MRKILIELSKRNEFLRKVFRKINKLYKSFIYIFYLFNKVDENMIVFESFLGKKYTDSPKALYEYLINDKKYSDYKFIWIFDNPNKYKNILKNKNTILIKYNSLDYYKYYSKAKYFVSNSRIKEEIKKKKNQIYVQTWHGTPLKRLGFDITIDNSNILNNLKEIKDKYESDAKRYDYMISPSKFCTEKFISAFNLKKINKENIIIEKGYPRNDFLFSYNDKDVLFIKKKLNIQSNKKIILYAPTFRDNQHNSKTGYIYELGINFDNLKKELEKEYIILFRTHYFVSNVFDFNKYKNFIYDVTNYDEVNDLYIISDILITDYSSVFFDYANLKRPMIFYMYDYDDYKNKLRDFYFDIKELPGKIVFKEKDLIKAINDTNNFEYNNKYKKFNNKFNYMDDKNSSKRVVEKIFK